MESRYGGIEGRRTNDEDSRAGGHEGKRRGREGTRAGGLGADNEDSRARGLEEGLPVLSGLAGLDETSQQSPYPHDQR